MNNFLVCPLFKNISHGFFNRLGGVSEGIYASLNCGFNSKDSPENVQKNRSIVMSSLNLNDTKLLVANQYHSSKVALVTKYSKKNLDADALITSNPNITLGVLTADCCPIIVCTKNQSYVASIHAGWKGALFGIVPNTINKLSDLGVKLDEIQVSIGPSIGANSYEVDIEFKKKFILYDNKSDIFFHSLDRFNKYLFDLVGYIEYQLISLGIKSIWIAREDTCLNNSLYFSYRYNRKKNIKDYGRLISVISLNK